MGRFVEVRNTWAGGDWGTLGAFRAGQIADGFFKSENMIVYDDGSIGPRVGYTKLAHTSVPTGQARMAAYAPVVADGVSGVIVFVVGNTAYWVPAFAAGATRTIGTLAGTETEFCSADVVVSSGNVYFLTATQGLYQWNVNAETLTQVASFDDETRVYDLARYKERLYVGALRRTYFSEAAAFATWDEAIDFFDVGWQFANYRLATLRNNLYFLRQGGGHYALSGVPESTAVLRETGSVLPPDLHSAVVDEYNDTAYWIPQERNAPVRFQGGVGDTRTMERLDDWTTSSSGLRFGAYSFEKESVLFLGSQDNAGLLWFNDVWTYHDFSDFDVQYPVRAGSDSFVLVDPGEAAEAPEFYLWDYDNMQPGVVGEDYRPGDNSDTPVNAWLHLPEWYHPRAEEARVVGVEVDFTTWDTSTSATAHFDLVVEALRQTNVNTTPTGGTVSQTYTFDEAVGSSATTGTERRIRFHTGDQGWGRGYQIRLTNIRNVSIRSVSAIVDDEPRDSR